MKKRIAKRMEVVGESATIRMAAATRALAAQGVKVVSFSVGEPNFPVPPRAANAAVAAIQDGFSKYTPVAGIPELRASLARKLSVDNGLTYTADQLVVSCGAKQAIFNFLLAVIDPGDEVLVPSPYWTSYPEMVKLAEGTPVIVKTTALEGFKLSPENLKKHLTPRTKALLLNSPSNPTGVVYSRAELTALARSLEGTDVLVCSDEIYEKLLYDGEFASFGAVSADAFQRTVTVNGFSKAYAMAGWRLGYAAGPKPIIDAMVILQGQTTSGANSVTQKAAVAALDIPAFEFVSTLQVLRARRDRMMAILGESRFLSFQKPAGAFYLFVNATPLLGKKDAAGQVLSTSEQLAFYLLQQAHVGCVAGSGFGEEGYLRLSFAVSETELENGCRQIVTALDKLR